MPANEEDTTVADGFFGSDSFHIRREDGRFLIDGKYGHSFKLHAAAKCTVSIRPGSKSARFMVTDLEHGAVLAVTVLNKNGNPVRAHLLQAIFKDGKWIIDELVAAIPWRCEDHYHEYFIIGAPDGEQFSTSPDAANHRCRIVPADNHKAMQALFEFLRSGGQSGLAVLQQFASEVERERSERDELNQAYCQQYIEVVERRKFHGTVVRFLETTYGNGRYCALTDPRQVDRRIISDLAHAFDMAGALRQIQPLFAGGTRFGRWFLRTRPGRWVTGIDFTAVDSNLDVATRNLSD